MKLASVTLANFRCFGPTPQVITLEPGISALLGSNGSGKSAALAALSKVFGLSSADRTLHRSDFHLPVGKTWDTVGSVQMTIELHFELPELATGEKTAAPAAMFKHLAVYEAGKPPACIARLQATWSSSTLAEGDIEQSLDWILASEKGKPEKTKSIGSADRASVVVHYIPATRDPIRHIRQSAGSILHGFLQAISWTPETKEIVGKASTDIRNAMGGEVGMKTVSSLVETCWQELYKEGTHSKVLIQPVAKRIEDLISQVDTVFQPTASNEEEGVDRLSDGQRSLFYIALVAMSFDVQARLRKDDKHGLLKAKVRSPVLTILAVEEPENHVSPHYLGRIVTLLKRIAGDPAGQVVLTSHSAAIMSRIEPESVRHLLLDHGTRVSTIRRIIMPTGDQEKFVREAVRAYPELYFARLVVLGEGDSEQILIPRLAKALGGVDLDPNLISFVPLGGRHVNHFWRLLKGLGIPHLTLLDLDFGRNGAGWLRIKYAMEQLFEFEAPAKELFKAQGAGVATMSDVHNIEPDKTLQSWIDLLETHGVYFAYPLDLDYSMLFAFPKAYQKIETGQKGPNAADDAALVSAVLADKSPAQGYYLLLGDDLLSWYRYLFLGRGKPATHAAALLRLTDAELVQKAPPELKRLIAKLVELVQPAKKEEDFPWEE
ncbi:MAG TPA: TOPRIM nucleotidyl transferase/hydrolase domain-containing protein [Lacunisphaera sp.]|nr:TOPRIM nucleotidyl transferase/hydrolase domain-containing protein [Lacunisphaera sp.]